MRLKSLRIRNYRSFNDTTIDLAGYNCFVGPNGAGKSSILCALNILFRDSSNPTSISTLSEEDFHLRNTDDPIEITVTFGDLSAEAASDLDAYVRQGELTITARATWDEDRGYAEVRQYGSRMVMHQFAPYFEAVDDGARVADLVPMYEAAREEFPELPNIRTKVGMMEALRAYEEAHPELCEPHESSDQFYGWSKGANRLAPHVQWVFIPAVKDASEEEVEGRATALGLLLQRSIRAHVDFNTPLSELKRELEERYQAVIEENRDVLAEVSENIQTRLRDWSHPGAQVQIDWSYDQDRSLVVNEPVARVSLGEGTFQGELARLGHGLQRSFIVALLTEVASTEYEGQPSLILGFEEPELYQHPPQARHLAAVLEQLSDPDGQVLVTTHSPYFVSGQGFENVRMTRKDPASGVSDVSYLSHESLSQSLAEALGEDPSPATAVMAAVEQVMQPSQNEMFFCGLPVLVEGIEDVAYITTQFHLRGDWAEFRRHGGHFVVCGGKTSMSRPLAIAEGLGIRSFVIFDADFNEEGKDEKQHRRDNRCLLRLAGYPNVEPWANEIVRKDRLTMFSTNTEREVQDEVGLEAWSEAKQRAKERMGIPGPLSKKNTMWITATLEILQEAGVTVEVLDQLCTSILAYAVQLEEG